jgi:hypothetical protein
VDDRRPRIFSDASSARCTACGFAIILSIALTSCFTAKPQLPPQPTPTAFAALSQELAKFRGLQIRRDIILTRDTPNVSEIDSYGPFKLQQVERVYRSLGLLPNNVDLGKAVAEYRKLAQLAVYDAAQGTVAIAPEANRLSAAVADSASSAYAREAPLGFAVVTALQEQNFQWQQKLTSVYFEDRSLAFRAVASGDAMLTNLARADRSSDRKFTATDLATGQRFARELEKSAARLPEFLRQKLTFPFREGIQFAYWAYDARGWPGVNALYADPPVSTAQIRHPEKYFIQRELPKRFFPAALLASMKNSTVVEQSLGEELIRVLLATTHSGKIASETATPWRGDQLFAFQEGEELTTAWYSSWASVAEATAFLKVYRIVLEKRQRVRFESAGRNSDRQDGQSRDGRAVTLQINGPVVLYLTGVPAHRLNEFADKAWQDLEIDSDLTAASFDLAKRPTTH